jgi:hypothetical protein
MLSILVGIQSRWFVYGTFDTVYSADTVVHAERSPKQDGSRAPHHTQPCPAQPLHYIVTVSPPSLTSLAADAPSTAIRAVTQTPSSLTTASSFPQNHTLNPTLVAPAQATLFSTASDDQGKLVTGRPSVINPPAQRCAVQSLNAYGPE